MNSEYAQWDNFHPIETLLNIVASTLSPRSTIKVRFSALWIEPLACGYWGAQVYLARGMWAGHQKNCAHSMSLLDDASLDGRSAVSDYALC